MQNEKTIFVTGATGNQGSSVVRSLVSSGFKVKALSRDPLSAKAQNLKIQNVEWIQGDLNVTSTYSRHLRDIDGIFCVLTYTNGVEKEKTQGLDLVRLAKENGIKHFLYSSVIGCDLQTGIPHWESKFVIENRIKQIQLPYTIIRPTSFFENFLLPQVKSRILKGKLPSPVNKDVVQQFISASDIGEISRIIFMDPQKYLDKTLVLAAEEMDMGEVAQIFSDILGRKIQYQKLPMFVTRLVMGRDLYKMFEWVNEHDAVFVKDLDAFRKTYPNLTGIREWITHYFKGSL